MIYRKKLIWRLYPSFILVAFISMFAVGWYASVSMKKMYMNHLTMELQTKAQAVNLLIEDDLKISNLKSIDEKSKIAGKKMQVRVTVILPSGIVVGDSLKNPSLMDYHGDRPEIKDALKGNAGLSIRKSPTLGIEMLYVAVPIKIDGRIYGVTRVSLPMNIINEILKSFYLRLIFCGLLVVFAASVVAWFATRRIVQPIEEMKKYAEEFAKGNFKGKIMIHEIDELASLAESLNKMAFQLDGWIRTISNQKSELEAILSSMVEPVVVVDNEERVIALNQAAQKLFETPSANYEGRSIQEIIRNIELQHYIQRVLSGGNIEEGEIVVNVGEERFLQIHGTGLVDSTNRRIGAVFVLNDVTKLKKLEKIRRDFVANVSHEIKTPITSIKASVETLKDLVASDSENAKKFIDIIARHTDRLIAIIEDILMLARIEESEELGEIHLEEENLKQLLEKAVSLCKTLADERRIEVEIDCPDDIKVKINGLLVEQAVVNLLDNAIKYSEQGKGVILKGRSEENEIIIEVKDNGCGIPEEHLPRLFERFYRVDKARSRKGGGTGLGLAIVKHIVTLHKGRVTVESTPKKGSTFRIHLPL